MKTRRGEWLTRFACAAMGTMLFDGSLAGLTAAPAARRAAVRS
jgi:hypothetical protein